MAGGGGPSPSRALARQELAGFEASRPRWKHTGISWMFMTGYLPIKVITAGETIFFVTSNKLELD
jgi:hypothetical protein